MTDQVPEFNSSEDIVFFEDAQLARDNQPALNVWTDIYSYTGFGRFYGCLVNLEGASGLEGERWYVNVIIDDTQKIFGTNGIRCKDMTDNNIYDILDLQPAGHFGGLAFHDNVMRLDLGENPITFQSKLQVRILRTTSLKKFKAGLIKISKD